MKGDSKMNKNTVYVGTDKNGTKIYHDYTCSRCGGAGGASMWNYTGWTCYKCGGTGRQETPSDIIKVYTPEYEAKLEERRAKRRAKRQAELEAQKAQFHADLEKRLPQMLADNNFNANGKQYAVYGNTYPIKEELREAGAKWNAHLSAWVFADKPSQYKTVEIDYREYMFINDYIENLAVQDSFRSDSSKGVELVKSKMPQEEVKESHWVGNVGDKLEMEVTLDRVTSFEVRGLFDRMETRFVYSFSDANGNVFTWITGSGKLLDYETKTLTIKGTVKAHNEYKEVKQTALQRVAVKKG